MADHSSIEWTEATWNPTLGCDKVSAGCEHCYAIQTAYRQEHAFKRADYAGLTRKLPDGSLNWTGKVVCLPERLTLPLGWTTPRRIFVDSMSDLFHEDVPDEFIGAVFGVMALTPQHTFQVLTKRPQRMMEWLTAARPLETAEEFVAWHAESFKLADGRHVVWDARGSDVNQYSLTPMFDGDRRLTWAERAATVSNRRAWPGWPLPNVWLGVSVEDQRAADQRIPLLLQTPAAVRFLSCEPLLGPVNLEKPWPPTAPLPGSGSVYAPWMIQQLDWVIVGGESGPRHRPMQLDWARSLRDQCLAANVAFHLKQVGGRTHAEGGRELDGRTWDEFPAAAAVPA